MVELMILVAMVAACVLVHNWHKVFWGSEDWRRLRLGDDWDRDRSRGRLYKGWLR